MKKVILLLFLSCMGISVWAQSKDRPHMTSEEFRAKQKEYIIKKADLTKKEVEKFFPVFFELQDKKKKLNDDVWQLIKKGKNDKTTEEQYDEIINKVVDLRLKSDQVEKEYIKKFRKILSAKKVYNVQYAEMRFHRELLKDVNVKKASPQSSQKEKEKGKNAKR